MVAQHVAADDVGILQPFADLVQGGQQLHDFVIDGEEGVFDPEHFLLQNQLELPEWRRHGRHRTSGHAQRLRGGPEKCPGPLPRRRGERAPPRPTLAPVIAPAVGWTRTG